MQAVDSPKNKGGSMSVLPNYFKEALKNIEPDSDKKNAAKAHDEVRKVLLADSKLVDLGIDPILIGSYAREVSIRRVKDVDVFARLFDVDEDDNPKKILDLFEEVLSDKDAYGTDRVERQFRSIKVDFPDYGLTVDVVPARECQDHWEIPNREDDAERAQWVDTNPLKLNELTTEMNQRYQLNNEGIYVRIVKLVRQIRRTWLQDQPGGLYFELMTYWVFENGSPSCEYIAEYLAYVLDEIANMLPELAEDGLEDPTLPGNIITTKATPDDFEVAVKQIKLAATLAKKALEEEDDCKSAVLWRELLGETSDDEPVFPLPSYCNKDGSRKNVSSITSGATSVPAGGGRYA